MLSAEHDDMETQRRAPTRHANSPHRGFDRLKAMADPIHEDNRHALVNGDHLFGQAKLRAFRLQFRQMLVAGLDQRDCCRQSLLVRKFMQTAHAFTKAR